MSDNDYSCGHVEVGHRACANCILAMRARLKAQEPERAEGEKPYYHAYDLLKKGGRWLGAARERIQTMKCRGNGEHVTWGSSDVIEPHMTIGQVEEIAAYAAAAAFTERAEMEEQLVKLRKARLFDNIKVECERDRAIKVARKLLEALQTTGAGNASFALLVQSAKEALDAMPRPDSEYLDEVHAAPGADR